MVRKKIEIKVIIDFLGEQVKGIYGVVENRYIDNLADLSHTNGSTLDWIKPSKKDKQELAETSKAKVLLVDPEVVYSDKLEKRGATLIITDSPQRALAMIGNAFFVQQPERVIHPTAIVSPKAIIGRNVAIGPYSIVGDVVVGDDTVISSFVKLYNDTEIGKKCYIKEGAVIGGDGFGFVKDENGNRFRFPQLGGVRIGDNVEVGSNTCIDRGALSNTIIEDNVKIDNLCHIAHNVHIGSNSVVVACSEISGSCEIGENVWIGPNVSIRDQRKVGDNVLVGMGSVVVKNIDEGVVCAGNPAKLLR